MKARWFMLISLFLVSLPALADDIQLLRTSLTKDGIEYAKTYLASIERATLVPCDPLNGEIPLSFEKALSIALNSIPNRELYKKIELRGSELRLCICEPRFYYWHVRFMNTMEGELGKAYHVIVLMDGSVVEPKVEEVTQNS